MIIKRLFSRIKKCFYVFGYLFFAVTKNTIQNLFQKLNIFKTELKYQEIKILGWSPVGPVLTSWGGAISLALIGHPSSDVVTTKLPYGVDGLH